MTSSPPNVLAGTGPVPLGEGCPITADFLPPNMRKHVDISAPAALRMMAAKSLVPLSPPDMLGALYVLTFDPEPNIVEAARKTAGGLPDRILGAAFRDEGIPAPVLGWFLTLYGTHDAYAEMLVLNGTTPDEAVAVIAATCSPRIAEIIGQNQLRLLRHENVVRQLCANPGASPALLDSVCDFAVRSGLVLLDVPQMQAARVRLYGPEAATKPPPDPGPTAEEILKEFAGVADENAPPMEEGKRLSLTQRIMKMNISQKIKLATMGNKEARSLLIRDSNKLVAVAVIRSPRLTDGEVLVQCNNKAANEDVLRVIYGSKEWTKSYLVKVALVKNPKVPMAISMRFLSTLRESDVKDLARNKNVPSSIQGLAKKMIDKKNTPKQEK